MKQIGILAALLLNVGLYPVSHGQDADGQDPAVLAFKSQCDKNPAHTSDDGRRICTCLAMRTRNNASVRDDLMQKLVDPKRELGDSAQREMSYCSIHKNYRSYTITI